MHIHTAGGERGYILLALEKDTPGTSILLVVERDRPNIFILLAVEGDTPCMSILLVLVKRIPSARP